MNDIRAELERLVALADAAALKHNNLDEAKAQDRLRQEFEKCGPQLVRALLACLECLQMRAMDSVRHREDDMEVCYDWCPACAVDRARAALSEIEGKK